MNRVREYTSNDGKIARHSTNPAVEDQEDIPNILFECGDQRSRQMCGIQ